MKPINVEAEIDLQDLMDEIIRQTDLCIILDMMLDSIHGDRVHYVQKAGELTRHIRDRIEKDTWVRVPEDDEALERFQR